jgi:hypothetical protein
MNSHVDPTLRQLIFSGRIREAEALIDRMIGGGGDPVAWNVNRAVCLGLRGAFDEAWSLLGDLAASPALPEPWRTLIRYNLGWHEIRRGDFRDGIRGLCSGRALGLWGSFSGDERSRLRPGERVDGRRILVCGEGGAGDEIINARFASLIRERGGRVEWITPNALEGLFSRVPGIEAAWSHEQAGRARFDRWVPAMDLPWVLDLGAKDICAEPYLSASASSLDEWARRAPRDDGRLKVGLRWKGNPRYEASGLREISFRDFAALLEISGIDFYSLQRDEGSEELDKSSGVTDWGSALRSWEDTAAAISGLDVVISSCTSVAHLSAAMGKATWVVPPVYSYYVWASPPERIRWYANTVVFRQLEVGQWAGPVAEVARRLSELALKPPPTPIANRRTEASAQGLACER